jgi:MFS family permease
MFVAIMIGALLTGQLITRTEKYKVLAFVGMGITIVGALLLLRLDLASNLLESISAVGVMGLGVGINLALYGTIVQSAFPQRRLAQATSTLDFFQELGGPVALAIMGSIQASMYLPAFHTVLPPVLKQLVPAPVLLLFDKPDILLNTRTQQAMRVRFATFGAQGQHLLGQIINAVKEGLLTVAKYLYLLYTSFIFSNPSMSTEINLK